MFKLRLKLVFITLYLLSGCSFHSSQYDLLINTIKPPIDEGPKPNWNAIWRDESFHLYAINHDSRIIFANENIQIWFDGEDVNQVSGLFGTSSIIEIEKNSLMLTYNHNGVILGEYNCEQKKLIYSGSKLQKYKQTCYDPSRREFFDNEIIFNENGQVTSISYKIHPDYPLIELNFKLHK